MVYYVLYRVQWKNVTDKDLKHYFMIEFDSDSTLITCWWPILYVAGAVDHCEILSIA
jgi:hypothetical protein